VFRSSCRLAPTLFTKKPGSRLPTLRLPIRFGVQFKLFWCYYAQRRAGHPRSSPSPLRGKRRLRRHLPFWFCQCVLAIQLSACADAIHQEAQRSVAHLTFAKPSWRSVPTCSVLLRTEAGGTPCYTAHLSISYFFREYGINKIGEKKRNFTINSFRLFCIFRMVHILKKTCVV
jgi:hypothetical protein